MIMKSPQNIQSNDVLFGRGGITNHNEGNKRFRALVAQHQKVYLKARKTEKSSIAKSIVATIQSRGGRFLKYNSGEEDWVEVTDPRTVHEKTAQALRENLDMKQKRFRYKLQVLNETKHDSKESQLKLLHLAAKAPGSQVRLKDMPEL